MPIFSLIVAFAAVLLIILMLRAWHRQILCEREQYLLEVARWRCGLDDSS